MSESTATFGIYPGYIRQVPVDEPLRWLVAGWQDFRNSRGLSSAYAFVFVFTGLLLTAGLTLADMGELVVPLAAGFLLVGPALAVGFQAISRDLEAGREPTLRAAAVAWRNNPSALLAMGLAVLLFMMLWLLFAALGYALSFPDSGLDWARAAAGLPYSPEGGWFLGTGLAVGAVMATIVLAVGAFSLPLMLDRHIGLAEAVATSAAAVMANLPTMAVWAGLVVLLTAAGLASWYVGLCITLPLVGHASWHAYRAVIGPARSV